MDFVHFLPCTAVLLADIQDDGEGLLEAVHNSGLEADQQNSRSL